MDDGCRLDLTRSKTIFANSVASGDGGCLLVTGPWRLVPFEEIFESASGTKSLLDGCGPPVHAYL